MICHSPRLLIHESLDFLGLGFCQVMSSFCFTGFFNDYLSGACYINCCAAGGSGHRTPLLPRFLWGTRGHHDVALRQGLSGGSTGRNEPLKSTGDWFLLGLVWADCPEILSRIFLICRSIFRLKVDKNHLKYSSYLY